MCRADFWGKSINFNSIKVQLKLNKRFIIKANLFKFQFHKGTIKTPFRLLVNIVLLRFQFHKGTIKTK